MKVIAALGRDQQAAGVHGLGGSVSRASTAQPKVASGVEQLQIIFMGDNKNVLPHNQH